MLRLRLLGALTAEMDGRPVAMPSSERARDGAAWVDALDGDPAADAGELLPGVDDDRADEARDEFRGRRRQAFARMADAAERDGRFADAVRPDTTDTATRADVLIGLAWGEAVAGDPAEADRLLSAAEALLPDDPPPQVQCDIAEIRTQGLIRRGRFAEAAAVAQSAGPAAVRCGLPDPRVRRLDQRGLRTDLCR